MACTVVLCCGCGGAIAPSTDAADLDAAPVRDLAIADGGDAGAVMACAPFTRFPMMFDPDPMKSDLRFVVPLGNLNPPGHVFPTDHLYLAGRLVDPNNPDSAQVDVPIVAPGDANIVSIEAVQHHFAPGPNNPPDHTDYSLFLQSCPALLHYFAHVGALDAALVAETARAPDHCDTYTAGPDTVRDCQWYVSRPVRAGDPLGRASTIHEWVDFGAYDARVAPLDYVNPARTPTDPSGVDLLHVACPLDYLVPDVRNAVVEYLGIDDLRRSASPRCGDVNQDIAGTAQGRWYAIPTPMKPADNYPESPHLALVHDNVDPTLAAISMGTSVPGLDARVYTFTPHSDAQAPEVDRDFADLRPDGTIHCFDSLRGDQGDPLDIASPVILVALVDAQTLKVARVAGAADCAAAKKLGNGYSLAGAVTFYR